MKNLIKASVLSVLATVSASAGVAFADTRQEMATVVSATPIYQRVSTPRRECWTEQVAGYEEQRYRTEPQRSYREPREASGGGALLGAIVGGVIGRQFGNSTGGRDRGTAAGAVIGGLIGNDIERNSDGDRGYYRTSRDSSEVRRVPVTRNVQRCETVADTAQEISGYDVVYRYNGRDYTARLPYDPGQTLTVEVNVRPLGNAYGQQRQQRQHPVPTYRDRGTY